MKKVSIIIPVYKSEQFLEKLINSILEQTYTNFELILVDDGSPDNSGLICDQYSKIDSRIVVIHKINGGTCEARNYGLDRSTGEYIMLADGDDWLAKDCIEYLVGLLENNDADMSMSDCVFTTRNFSQNEHDNIRVMGPEEAASFILYAKTPIGPWNKLYKRSIIIENELKFSIPWFGEGLYFSVMAAQYSKKIAVGHRKVYVYRMYNVNSGTTVGEVEHGINALNNIKYIKNNLVIKTKKTENACDWHIWNNYYNLIIYIVGANSMEQYCNEINECKKYIRMHLFSVLCNSEIDIKKKIIMMVQSLCPILMAKFIIKRRRKLLLMDNAE